MSVLAIIPAAGTGVRMGSGTPKQFLALEGVPIFVHTLRKFSSSDVVRGGSEVLDSRRVSFSAMASVMN